MINFMLMALTDLSYSKAVPYVAYILFATKIFTCILLCTSISKFPNQLNHSLSLGHLFIALT